MHIIISQWLYVCYLLQTKLASYREFIKQEMTENTANNMNCSLCAKLIKILKHNPECGTELKCDECGDDNDPVVALCVECKCFLCQDCNKAHSKKYESHDILSLSSTKKDLLFNLQVIRLYTTMLDKHMILWKTQPLSIGIC